MKRVEFHFDFGSPNAYLSHLVIPAIEARTGAEFEYVPILLGGLFKRFGRDSWARGEGRDQGMREVERRASAYGLPPIKWPEPFPGNTLLAMRAATYAKEIGRGVSFSLAAFRQAFAAGRDLTEPDNVLLAAAAAEMHPRAVLSAIERESVKRTLREATALAGDLGVRGVPSIAVGGQIFWGDDRLEEAVALS